MALPKLNETIKYKTTIPSTNQTINYRPYLVKEEKILLMAMELGKQESVINAIADTIQACIDEDINVKSLPMFDIEYLFLKVRAKSVGESIKVGIACKECKTPNEVSINIDEIKISVPRKKKTTIKLTDSISIEMKYPSMDDMLKAGITDENLKPSEKVFRILGYAIEAVISGDDRILMSEETEQSKQEFIESFTSDQLKEVNKFVEEIPSLKHVFSFDCINCGAHNEETVEGAQNFF